MLKILLAALFLSIGLTVSASDGHDSSPNQPSPTPAVCSEVNAGLCARLEFLSALNSSTEGEFILHVKTLNNTPASNVKVSLWMNMGGHGHGSAPVEVAALEQLNSFKISNAWFVMAGTWDVQVEFTLEGEIYKLAIPVNVTE